MAHPDIHVRSDDKSIRALLRSPRSGTHDLAIPIPCRHQLRRSLFLLHEARCMSASELPPAHVLLVATGSEERELAAVLEQAGYRVSVVAHGEDALHLHARTPADVVLLDVAAHEHDGLATCRRLRASSAGEQLAILLIAESDVADVESRVLDSGADDLLIKPLRRSELMLRVRALVRVKQQCQQSARALDVVRVERDELLRLSSQREENTALLVHDMKNPLAGVLSNAEFLTNSAGLDEDQEGCAHDILHAARRLHRMVLSMLDLSHSEHGVLAPSAASLDLAELIDAVQLQCSPKLRDKAVTLTVQTPPQPVRLDVDRDMLTRLLANLLDSAIRHAPSSTGVGLHVSADATSVELRVSDAGPRVPEAERTELFDSYARMTDAAGRVRPRRGLGLSSSRAVAEAHGGEIWVEDNAMGGATLCVRLPRIV